MIKKDAIAPVSVVIPCFRCGKTIREVLTSIVQQSKVPAEIILVDDASGDDTWSVMTDLANAYPGWIKLLRFEENQGAASARNAGWAAWLNSNPDKIVIAPKKWFAIGQTVADLGPVNWVTL